MKKRRALPPVSWQVAVLAALAVLAVIAGAFLIHRQLRDNQREQAFAETRQLAFGVARQASESFWRTREEFIFSLTNLPYEQLIRDETVPSEALVPVRRFLALNQSIIRELVVTGPHGQSRSAFITGENYFTLSALSASGPPRGAGMTTLSGIVQGPDGSVRAHVTAVIDPVRFWQDHLNAFALSHPHLWVHLLDENGRPLLARHGVLVPKPMPAFSSDVLSQLAIDGREGYEGRTLHSLAMDGRSVQLISAHVPLRLETWRGLVMISADEQAVLGAASAALRLLGGMSTVLVLLLLALFVVFVRHSSRTHAQISDSRLRIETVLNTVQSGIILAQSRTDCVTEVNAAALALLGARATDILGRPLGSLLSGGNDAPHHSAKSGTSFEARIRTLSGVERHILAAAAPLTIAHTPYLLFSFVDITPLKETESRLHEAVARAEKSVSEAEAANRAKSAFLAMMSHELRTPLNSILGLSETLIEGVHGVLNQKQAHYMRLVLGSGRNLLSLINDILDLARVESDFEGFTLVPTPVRTLCETAVQAIRPVVERSGQRLHVELPDEPLDIRADPARMQQVLLNLLGNAVKFTTIGGALGLRVTSTPVEIHMCVWDEGIGIAEENLERIFMPFVQVDARLSREYGGTGMGLTLVKRFVELHGGRVELSSTLGRGSRFTLILPRVAQAS